MAVSVRVASSDQDIDDVRTLMRAFVARPRKRHVQDIALIDAYFEAVTFA